MLEPLLPVASALAEVGGTSVYWACRAPALLAGMPLPRGVDWEALAAAGLTDVVSLMDRKPAYDPSPLKGHCRELQDLAGGQQPRDPALETARLDEAVRLVRGLLDEGRGTIVHCWGGRGRTGTVLGAVLVSLGHEPGEVAAWLNAIHQARGKSDGWPESPWQIEALEAYR